jgi:hypothetical protein
MALIRSIPFPTANKLIKFQSFFATFATFTRYRPSAAPNFVIRPMSNAGVIVAGGNMTPRVMLLGTGNKE